MKKSVFILVAFCALSFLSQAQDLTSKKGIPILPEAGEFGLSIDAVPFFSFVGNMFNGNEGNNVPYWNFPSYGYGTTMYTLSGKYFKTPKFAYRARVRLGYFNETIKNTIADQTGTAGEDFVDDKWTHSDVNVVIGAGIEKRKGKGRVQGLYGGMFNIMVSKEMNSVKYGNEINSDHTAPLSTVYPWITIGTGSEYMTNNLISRTTKDNEGLVYGGGVSVFAGVEYFFAPKMSIGGEFSFAAMIAFSGKNMQETEYWDASTNSVKIDTQKSGGKTIFGIDNTNSGGSINLNFYF